MAIANIILQGTRYALIFFPITYPPTFLNSQYSKFGTKAFIEREEEKSRKGSPKCDSETDDETDDEGAVAASVAASSQISAVAQHHLQDNNYTIREIEKNKSIILSTLSLPKRTGVESRETAPPSSVLVQVGVAMFKITRIPLDFCCSRLSTKEKRELEDLAPSIGATITSTFQWDTITHLISPDQSSTAKFISAWSLNVPTVTGDFMRAIAERDGMGAAFPDVQKYEAPPAENMFENDIGVEARRQILSGYKVLSLMASEGEILCRCTGATIVPLYRELESGDDGGKVTFDQKFWQTDEFFEDLERKRKEDGLIVVWLECASRRLKKGKDYLVKKMKEQQQNAEGDEDGNNNGYVIRCVNQQGVARAISENANLMDTDGNELIPSSMADHKKANQSSADATKSVEIEENPQSNSESQSNQKSVLPSRQTAQMPKDVEAAASGSGSTPGHTMEVDNYAFETIPESITETDQGSISSKQHKQTRSQSDQSSQKGWMNSSKSKSSRHLSQDKLSQLSQESDRGKVRGDEGDEMEVEADYTEMKQNDENEKPNKRQRKKKLKETSDGWMCAAPQGEARTKFKRSRAELSEIGEITLSNPAETEFKSNLVVRTKKDIQRMKEANENAVTPATLGGVKNFKRFKKNSIIPGAKMHSISEVRLISVLPKESERLKELQARQSELEREQRAADSLFTGEDGARKGKGIRNYLKGGARSGSRGRGKKR